MKTRLLKRLRKEAKKKIRIKQEYGGLQGPRYSIDNCGVTYQDPQLVCHFEDHPYFTYDLADAINNLYELRRGWMICKVYRIRLDKAKEAQPEKYLDI